MFGASRRIAVEIEEEIKPLPFILLPDNKLRMIWNLVTLVLLLYTASFVPYETSFVESDSAGLAIWEWIVNGLFMLDLVLNFISAYENSDKNVEVRMRIIAKNYIESWFLFDLLACIPFSLLTSTPTATVIMETADQTIQSVINANTTIGTGSATTGRSTGSANKLIRLARLPRLYRLLRILRLFKIFNLMKNNASFKKLQEAINLNAGVQRMLLIALAVFFMVHLMACLFFLVSTFEDPIYEFNWVNYYGIEDSLGSYQYLISVYWAL